MEKHQGRGKRGRPPLRWEDCVRRDMRRSGEDERWREGAANRKLWKERTERVATLTPVQLGTRRKSTNPFHMLPYVTECIHISVVNTNTASTSKGTNKRECKICSAISVYMSTYCIYILKWIKGKIIVIITGNTDNHNVLFNSSHL